MKITNAKSAAAAFPDAPEECREWCRLGSKRRFVWYSRHVLSVDEAVSRTAKVALGLFASTIANEPGHRDAFLRMMAGGDERGES